MQKTQSFLLYYFGFSNILAHQTCVGWGQFLNNYFYLKLGSKKILWFFVIRNVSQVFNLTENTEIIFVAESA